MSFLYLLERIRNPFLDFFFSTVTHLGEEIFFLAFAIMFFWCVNKREGYFILVTGLVGTVINQIMKLWFKIPRPWVKDPNFTIVESAYEEATGYSFPSGHTQNVAGTFGAIARWHSGKAIRVASLVIIVLVALSRMYLGVHTPVDVVVSLVFASALVFLLYPMFKTEERFHRFMPYIIGISFAFSLIFAIYCAVISPDGLDLYNYESAKKNAATIIGSILGLCVVYPLDRFKIKFETKANWYSQIIKLALGIGVVMLAKEGLRAPIEWFVGLFTDSFIYIARAIRYFIVVLFAGALWPLTFKYFSNLKIGFMERFTAWLLSKLGKTSHAPTDDE